MRIRGNAWQVNEKYLTLARDAASSGDRIQAENYLQHAEHYFRIINQIQEAENRQRDSRGNGQSPHLSYQDEDDQGDGDGEGEMDAEGGEDHAQMNA